MQPKIQNIVNAHRLLKRANCEPYVRISELAKELRCAKTELMCYIEEHPDLFVLREPARGEFRSNPGLLVVDAFTTPEENYTGEAFLEALKEKNKDVIYVKAYVEYEFKGWYIPKETSCKKESWNRLPPWKRDWRERTDLWRNTPEKTARIEAAGHCRGDYYWGGGDGMSKIWFEHCVTADDLRALKAEGWTITGDPETKI